MSLPRTQTKLGAYADRFPARGYETAENGGGQSRPRSNRRRASATLLEDDGWLTHQALCRQARRGSPCAATASSIARDTAKARAGRSRTGWAREAPPLRARGGEVPSAARP